MKSSIKIDFTDNGKGLEPVLQVILHNTDDPRDKLLSSFFQKLGGNSNWVSVSFNPELSVDDGKRISMYPLAESELKETAMIIERRLPFEGIGVMDNCHGFHAFLEENKIEFKPNGHFTTILKEGVDLFSLGQKFQQYKDNSPLK